MSQYLHSRSFFDSFTVPNHEAVFPVAGEPVRQRVAADHVVDSALRNVPLPDGMMVRLEKLVRILPDDHADEVDWLGC